MKNILVYPLLGLSRRSRMHRLGNRMKTTAEAYYEMGIDSRIPYLQKVLLDDMAIQDGPSTRADLPIPDYKEGMVLREGIRLVDIIRFNIFHASEEGLIALPFKEESGEAIFKVLRCQSKWLGDLRVYFNLDFSPSLRTDVGEGAYFERFHHIILKRDCSYDSISLLHHELEHAVHQNLSRLGGFPEGYHPPSWCAEYLAYLQQHILFYDVDLPNLILRRKPAPNLELSANGIKTALPHHIAAAFFISRLLLKHRMSLKEIAQAVNASHACDGTMSSIERHANFPQLRKMWGYAKAEFEEMYLHLYGLDLEDIKDVVSSLPRCTLKMKMGKLRISLRFCNCRFAKI